MTTPTTTNAAALRAYGEALLRFADALDEVGATRSVLNGSGLGQAVAELAETASAAETDRPRFQVAVVGIERGLVDHLERRFAAFGLTEWRYLKAHAADLNAASSPAGWFWESADSDEYAYEKVEVRA